MSRLRRLPPICALGAFVAAPGTRSTTVVESQGLDEWLREAVGSAPARAEDAGPVPNAGGHAVVMWGS